jgi:hypothetical protein
MNIHIFYHIAMVGRWKDVVEEQVLRLASRGPRNAPVFAYAVGPESLFDECKSLISKDNFVLQYGGPLDNFEFPALQGLHDFSIQQGTGHLLYLHTKGVSKFATPHDVPCTDWRRFMEHSVIDNYLECIKLLEHCDACGANFVVDHSWGTHFSGNMWWTKAEYVKTLPVPRSSSNRYDAERWICSKQGRFASTVKNEAAGYDHLLPEWRYADAERTKRPSGKAPGWIRRWIRNRLSEVTGTRKKQDL